MDGSSYAKEMAQVVTIVDVYDSAALIGKDFEYIIEQFGVEAVTELMPKVIRVLEQLEYLANQHEHENEEIGGLENTIAQLNLDKEERQRERLQYEQELEQVEESWQKESQELMAQVARLQEQNRMLHSRLVEKSQGQQAAVDDREEELELLQSLRTQVTEQRNQIKTLQRDVKLKQSDVDSLRSQTSTLENENEVLRQASTRIHSQTQNLISEHSKLQSSVQEKDDQIQSFLYAQEKTKHNTFQIQVNQLESRVRESRLLAHIRTNQAKQMISEKSNLQSDILNLNQQIMALAQDKLDSTDTTDMLGKMIADKNQETPRFTLAELRDILMERNTLKSKLIEVEEELSFYKDKENEASGANNLESETSQIEEEDEETYVGPVQGPINREPWEKLYGYPQPSGIRKFFKFLGSKNESNKKTRRK